MENIWSKFNRISCEAESESLYVAEPDAPVNIIDIGKTQKIYDRTDAFPELIQKSLDSRHVHRLGFIHTYRQSRRFPTN